MEETGLLELTGAALGADDHRVEPGCGGEVDDGLDCGFVISGDQNVKDVSCYGTFTEGRSERGVEGLDDACAGDLLEFLGS
ncbi:hypothetical protein AAHB34_20700 [Paenarthrobacter ureafaciens]|nr:hypothetical protein [Paenarthrobacter ureafaciens]